MKKVLHDKGYELFSWFFIVISIVNLFAFSFFKWMPEAKGTVFNILFRCLTGSGEIYDTLLSCLFEDNMITYGFLLAIVCFVVGEDVFLYFRNSSGVVAFSFSKMIVLIILGGILAENGLFWLVLGPAYWICAIEAIACVVFVYKWYPYIKVVTDPIHKEEQDTQNEEMKKDGVDECKAHQEIRRKYKLVCLKGEYESLEFPIAEGESIRIGRNPGWANVVMLEPTISDKHCEVYCDKEGSVYLIDYSSNGTFDNRNNRFPKDEAYKCENGMVFNLVSAEEQFKLIIEEILLDDVQREISDQSDSKHEYTDNHVLEEWYDMPFDADVKRRIMAFPIVLVSMLLFFGIFSSRFISLYDVLNSLCNIDYMSDYDVRIFDDQWIFHMDDIQNVVAERLDGNGINTICYNLKISIFNSHLWNGGVGSFYPVIDVNVDLDNTENRWKLNSAKLIEEETNVEAYAITTPYSLYSWYLDEVVASQYRDDYYGVITCQYMGTYDNGKYSEYYLVLDRYLIDEIVKIRVTHGSGYETINDFSGDREVDNTYADMERLLNHDELFMECDDENPVFPR